MIKPHELSRELPVKLSIGAVSTTAKVWEILSASNDGSLSRIRQLVNECPELAYAQYNYAPPIHFAVREGHTEIVKFLLDLGAHDPDYKFYPFQESLQTVASDRGFIEIENLLNSYAEDGSRCRFKGDNGEILYEKTDLRSNFKRPFMPRITKGHRRS